MKLFRDSLSRIAYGLFAAVAVTGPALAGDLIPPVRVPEPATLAILAGGAATAIYLRRRNRRK